MIWPALDAGVAVVVVGFIITVMAMVVEAAVVMDVMVKSRSLYLQLLLNQELTISPGSD